MEQRRLLVALILIGLTFSFTALSTNAGLAAAPAPLFETVRTGARPTATSIASPTPVPSWDATNLRVGEPPPTDTGIEPAYPGQCSSDLSGFGASPNGKSGSLQVDEKHLRIIIAERLLSCTQQILRTTPYQRYVVGMQQTIVQSRDCNPEAIMRSDDGTTSLSTQKWIDLLDLCANYVAALSAVQNSIPILSAKLPVVYVLMASGGVPVPMRPMAKGGGGGGQAASSSQGGGGASAGGAASASSPSGGGATNSNSTIDSTTAALLYTVAMGLQNDLSKTPLPSNTLVVPAALWTIEDFDTECIENPLTIDKYGNYSGTYGAILLDSSTTISPYNFWLLWARGWAKVKSSITFATCESGVISDTDQPPVATIRWHSLLEGDGQRFGVPLFPAAAYAAYAVPGWSLRGTSTSTTSSTSQTTGNISTSQSVTQASVAPGALTYAEAAGLGTFLEGISGFTVGDLSSGVTVPVAYMDLARHFTKAFTESYCDGWLPNLQTNGCMRQAADHLFIQIQNLDYDCRHSRPNWDCITPNWRAEDIRADGAGNPMLELSQGTKRKAVCMTANLPKSGELTLFIGDEKGCSDPNGQVLNGIAARDITSEPGNAYARSLYCLIESNNAGVGVRACTADNPTPGASQRWATPPQGRTYPNYSDASLRPWIQPTPNAKGINFANDRNHHDGCEVTTSINRKEATMTAFVRIKFVNPPHDVAKVRIKIAPLDSFGNPIAGEDPESVMIESPASEPTSQWLEIEPWIVMPHFVDCWPYSITYSGNRQPWIAPTPRPKSKAVHP